MLPSAEAADEHRDLPSIIGNAPKSRCQVEPIKELIQFSSRCIKKIKSILSGSCCLCRSSSDAPSTVVMAERRGRGRGRCRSAPPSLVAADAVRRFCLAATPGGGEGSGHSPDEVDCSSIKASSSSSSVWKWLSRGVDSSSGIVSNSGDTSSNRFSYHDGINFDEFGEFDTGSERDYSSGVVSLSDLQSSYHLDLKQIEDGESRESPPRVRTPGLPTVTCPTTIRPYYFVASPVTPVILKREHVDDAPDSLVSSPEPESIPCASTEGQRASCVPSLSLPRDAEGAWRKLWSSGEGDCGRLSNRCSECKEAPMVTLSTPINISWRNAECLAASTSSSSFTATEESYQHSVASREETQQRSSFMEWYPGYRFMVKPSSTHS